jgi:demethylmenaquinone methyltransferase/2-methoxy-6-polyprenyl-1,4-benzoquinol methylase
MSDKVGFGFKQVDVKEKQGLVERVFNKVAQKYDLMNDVMSFGVHRLWKAKLIEQLNPDKKLLDMAAGTGDIAKRYYTKCINPDITLCDINLEMLKNGYNKLIDENIFKGLKFACTNAEILPFEDNSFDYYTIAFGIRNVTDINAALKEAYRVLNAGGKFICLEFAKVDNPKIAKCYDFYSMNVIPKMGNLVAGDEDSYRYLVESIRTFPAQQVFIHMMEDAGFKFTQSYNLTFGVACLYVGYKA